MSSMDPIRLLVFLIVLFLLVIVVLDLAGQLH